MNFHLPSSLYNCPFADALRVFGYCISHPAESNNSAMHTDAWVQEAFVAWESLNCLWLMEEPGFIPDQVWADMQMYLWFAVNDLDRSQFKSDVVIAPLVLDMPASKSTPLPPLLLTPHHEGPWRMPSDDHSLPTTSSDVRSPVAGPSQPVCVISSQKLCTGRPFKFPKEVTLPQIKRGGFREPIPKNIREIPHGDLMPIGLVVPDQDFGDFVGCKGTLFKRLVAHKVGHFVTLVIEIRSLLCCLHQDACKMNATEDNIPSLFHASHLDTIELVSSLFEKGIIEDFVDLEAEEAAEDEDLDGEAGPDDE
ncbi:hypothetical protein F5146DRAFT_1006086 [Armillaria mellea]|nr:hypothetical protein F5146DRAFT_1006086 [Armillaria mellea]